MLVGVIVNRVVMLVVATVVCAWLTSRVGPWAAAGLWSAAVVLVCSGSAILLHRQAPGRISVINRIAGLVLPWGYRIGRGRLVPIVVTSCVVWMLVGLGASLAMAGYLARDQAPPGLSADAGKPSALVMTLLYLSWLVDGALLMRMIGIAAARHDRVPTSVWVLILALTAMIGISAVVALRGDGNPARALLIAGGPPLLIGGGYGVFMLVIVLVGRKTRWN